MIDLGTIFSVIIGGVLTLLGTLLANYLQYRSEKRESQRERAKERFAEVRRYLEACLQFADSVSIPARIGPEKFDPKKANEWIALMADLCESWKSLPVNTAARVIYIEDEKTLQWLKQVDTIKLLFYFNYQDFIHTRILVNLEDRLQELQQLAAQISARLDQLFDQI
jgi:hypothetical protein